MPKPAKGVGADSNGRWVGVGGLMKRLSRCGASGCTCIEPWTDRATLGRLRPMLGFKTFYNARRVIIGIELAQKIHKRQFVIPIPWRSNPAVIWRHVMAA